MSALAAGLVVAVKPRWGGYLVGIWPWGIIINLFIHGAYLDIALRDFGLSLAAFSLARFADARTIPVPVAEEAEFADEEPPRVHRAA